MYMPTVAQRAEMARLGRKSALYGRLAGGFLFISAALWALYIALKIT